MKNMTTMIYMCRLSVICAQISITSSVQDTNTKQKATGKLMWKMFFLSAENVKNCLKSAVDVLSNHCRLHCIFITDSVM